MIAVCELSGQRDPLKPTRWCVKEFTNTSKGHLHREPESVPGFLQVGLQAPPPLTHLSWISESQDSKVDSCFCQLGYQVLNVPRVS